MTIAIRIGLILLGVLLLTGGIWAVSMGRFEMSKQSGQAAVRQLEMATILRRGRLPIWRGNRLPLRAIWTLCAGGILGGLAIAWGLAALVGAARPELVSADNVVLVATVSGGVALGAGLILPPLLWLRMRIDDSFVGYLWRKLDSRLARREDRQYADPEGKPPPEINR